MLNHSSCEDLEKKIQKLEQIEFESQQEKKRNSLGIKILHIINGSEEWSDCIEQVLSEIKQLTDFDAVAIRLHEGEDFPYYVTQGFPEDFVEAERFLCSRDKKGNIIRDAKGDPYVECMCGNVICGRTNPDMSFFTECGSFWSNHTSKLLAETSDEDRQTRTRNRCNSEGYESVALFPLRVGDEILGLLQINDMRTNQFTEHSVKFFEDIGIHIGLAFSRKQIKDALHKSHAELETKVEERTLELINTNRALFNEVAVRKKAQESLQESEEKYRELYECMREGFGVSDLNARIIEVNRAFADIVGYSEEELYELSYSDITPKKWHSIEEHIIREQVFKRGFSDLYVKEYLRKDGSAVPVELRATLITDDAGTPTGVWVIVRDISEHKKSEEALKQSEKKYKDLYNNANDMLVSIDAQTGVITDCNETLAARLGYAQHEVISRSVFDMYAPGSAEYVKKKIFPLFFETGTIKDVELQLLHKNGSLVDVNLNASAVRNEKGDIVFSSSTWRDITETKLLQERLYRSERLATVGMLATSVAHEINSPLQGITSLLGLMKSSYSNDTELIDEISLLEDGYRRVKDTVKSLLDLNRPEKEQHQPANINDIIVETLSLIRVLLKKSKIDVELNLSPDIPSIMASPQQLSHVFLNLFNNAIESIVDSGRPGDMVDNSKIQIDTKVQKKNLIIKISDTGSGIIENDMGIIFDPYYTRKKTMGIGVGLFICHGIIEEHNGHIEAENLPDGGAVFTITVPIE